MAKKSSSAPVPEESAPQPAEPPATNGGETANGRGSPPVWKKRLYGNGSFVECAVFRFPPEQGQPQTVGYSILLQRSFKDSEGNWKETRALRRDDLLVAGHILQRAYAWISEQEQPSA
jgi:hypothetical protein